MRLLVQFVFVGVLSVSICVDLCAQTCPYVLYVLVCVPIGKAHSAPLPAGPEGNEPWQPHIYLAAGCIPTSLIF